MKHYKNFKKCIRVYEIQYDVNTKKRQKSVYFPIK